jgi:hypothetical protein
MRQYMLTISRQKRSAHLWHLLTHQEFGRYRHARRCFHQCSKLAYRKHRHNVRPRDQDGDMLRLRQAIVELSDYL